MKVLAGEKRGVTLVELMIVMVVLAIGLLPIAIVQTRSSRDVVETGERTQALNIAQQQMEHARSLGFANAVPDSGVAGRFAWRRDVTAAGSGLRSVAVTVSWLQGGRTMQVQVRSLLSTR